MLRSRPLAPGSLLRLQAGDEATIVRVLERAYAVQTFGIVTVVLQSDVTPFGSIQ